MSDRLARARREMEAGRLQKARRRLEKMLAEAPSDQDVLELLGEVNYALGDHPAAGLAWFLTERTGADVDMAIAAARAATGNSPFALAARLQLGGPVEEFPPLARERLKSLQRDVWKSGRAWEPGGHREGAPAGRRRSRLLWRRG